MSLRSRLRQMRLSQLSTVQVASPCTVSWDEMTGDDKVRFCGQCQLHVYNLSAMDIEEAAAKVGENAERLCIRFYRRRDGTLLTQDCPVGGERKRQSRRKALVGAAVGSLAAVGFSGVFLQPTQGERISPAGMRAMLWNAAQEGDAKTLAEFLDGDFSPNLATPSGVTPLMFAAIGGHVEAVRLLLLRGAHVNTRDAQGRTALTDARTALAEAPAPDRQKLRKIIRLLKDAGASE